MGKQTSYRSTHVTVMARLLRVMLLLALVAVRPAAPREARAQSGVLHVDRAATGAGDGTSWGDAFPGLQAALDVAVPGDEVWVASGVYTPTARTDPGDPRTATFVLTDTVALYGGFAGIEAAREVRDWEANVTVLSGDLDGNDATDAQGVITTTAAITGSNAYNVVVGDGTDTTAVLDGFWITGGKADGNTWETNNGGGMRNWNGSPTLANLGFCGNDADYGGGGMSSYRADSTWSNITFRRNTANDVAGGLAFNSGRLTLDGAVFEENTTGNWGGGMNARDSDVTLRHVVFRRNAAGKEGGGMYSDDSNLVITNVVFEGNTVPLERTGGGHWGGGGLDVSGGNLQAVNVVFAGNTGHAGGGICIATGLAAVLR